MAGAIVDVTRTRSDGQCGASRAAARVRVPAATLLIIVAATFWSSACANDREQQPTAAEGNDSGSPTAGVASPVQSFIEFAATVGDPQSGLSGEQMADGLRKLAGALASLNAGSPDLWIDLRIGAEQVLLNPASTDTTAIIREAMVAAADAIERGRGPELALRETARSVRPDRPLMEQPVVVRDFFQQAAGAIQRAGP
jgi:hypothetical protein